MYWQDQLRQILREHGGFGDPLRIAVIGIGQELNGDDAVGILVIRKLKQQVRNPNLLVIETGTAPENFCGLLRRFHPNLVIMIDAANLGEKPGTTRCLPWQLTSGFGMSTHSLPLSVCAQYLSDELGCAIALLGIQPAEMSFDTGLSIHVIAAVNEIVPSLVEILSNGSERTPIKKRQIKYEP